MRRLSLLLIALLFVSAFASNAYAVQYIAPSNSANQSIGTSNLLYLDNTNGRVGMGTVTPGQRLEVNGNVKVGDNLIIGGYSNYKVYENLASLDNYGGAAGAIVIDTSVPFTAQNMFTISIHGYDYNGNGPWDVTVAAYAGEGSIYSARYVSLNRAGFGAPIIARNSSTGNVAVILGTTVSTYSYQITVTRFTQGFQNRVESYADGWTITPKTNVTGYDYQTTCVDTSILTGLVQSTATGTSYISGGNVGIGTTSPRVKTDVWGGALAEPTALASAVSAGTIILADSTGSVGSAIGVTTHGSSYDTYIQARNLGAASLAYNLNLQPLGGNVGIGTTNPGAMLHVDKSTSTGEGGVIFIKNSAGSAVGNKAVLAFGTDGGATSSNNPRIQAVNVNAGNGASELAFWTHSGGGVIAEAMRIDKSGNVGIGVTNPAELVEVYDGRANVATVLRLSNMYGKTNAGAYGYSRFAGLTGGNGLWISHNVASSNGGASALDDSARPGEGISVGQNYGGTAFLNYAAGVGTVTPSVSMFIKDNGNVGIGTATPATKLDVVGNGNFSGTVTVNSEVAVPATAGQGRIGGEATNGLRLIGYGSTYDVTLLNRGGSNAFGILANSVNAYFAGNVGIGTTAPAAKLEVVGPIVSNASAVGSAYVNVKVGGSSIGGIAGSGAWEGDSSTDFALYAETGKQLRFYTGGSATERAIIDSTGNMNITTGTLQFGTTSKGLVDAAGVQRVTLDSAGTNVIITVG